MTQRRFPCPRRLTQQSRIGLTIHLIGLSSAFLIALVAQATATGQDTQPKASAVVPSPKYLPEVKVQSEDYADARKAFRTKLLREGPSPQKRAMPEPPDGAIEVLYPSGEMRLKAWINRPTDDGGRKRPAILFLHGGFSLGRSDWDVTRPYQDAGYVILMPTLRGENEQNGTFTLYYDEVEDVLAAAEYLAKQSSVDPDRLYIAGHSSGGTLALLSVMSSGRFRAAVSFSGSPDQVLFFKHVGREMPFDKSDLQELQMRSPLAYAASVKCPLRIYYGSQEAPIHLTSQRTASVAKDRGLDVEAIEVEGGHTSSLPPAVKMSIDFFKTLPKN